MISVTQKVNEDTGKSHVQMTLRGPLDSGPANDRGRYYLLNLEVEDLADLIYKIAEAGFAALRIQYTSEMGG